MEVLFDQTFIFIPIYIQCLPPNPTVYPEGSSSKNTLVVCAFKMAPSMAAIVLLCVVFVLYGFSVLFNFLHKRRTFAL